jgi:hypothetical protein
MAAQNPHRQGLWAEVGGGRASIRMGCAGCDDVTRAGGSAGYLRVGGTLSPKVLLAGEIFGFTDENFGFTGDGQSIVADCASIAAVVLWYPWRSHFFLKSGVGMAEGSFIVQPEPEEFVIAEGFGVGLTFGIGLDVPISRKLALAANASTFFTAIGDIVLPAQRVEDVIPTTYVLSIGVVIR